MSRRPTPVPAGRLRTALRWTLALALLGFMVGGGGWGLSWVLEPATLPMERVSIDGDIRHTQRKELEQAVAAHLGGGFFRIDLDAVRDALERLPWVTRASVRRVWPGALEVRVEERRALAHWGADDVVNAEGEVFHPEAASVPRGLPRLSGPDGSAPRVVERYRLLRDRLRSDGLEIAELSLSARHAWTLDLTCGLRLQLGNRDLEARVERFLRHYGALLQQGRPELVDLRYANGFAVRLQRTPEDGKEKSGTEG